MSTAKSLLELLAGFQADPESQIPPALQKALFLARRLQERAVELQTAPEKRQQAELDRMLQSPTDKATLAQITDQAFRTKDPHRAVERLIHILDVQGIPRFFNPWDRTLMKGFQSFGALFPGVALPLVREHMRKETANVILPGEKELLTRHLSERAREGARMNVNFLGEAILSEGEAERRLEQYLESLEWPEIEVVSIKISTLYSQISPLAREKTLAILCNRLERLFLAAAETRYTRPDGTSAAKFVYLDMEEYRDKDLTAEAFMRTLDRPGLTAVQAGIALQAYIPDSFRTLRLLQDWARRRQAAGGARITVRLVKGANLEMERVEASLRGWPQAPFSTKLETDASFKRMLQECLLPQNLAAMDVAVASHNLFDLAYGLVLAQEHRALDHVQFEMLEGMANPQRRALFELSHRLLLYAPACKKANSINAIGYLIRRLDENTGPDNFLRYAFKLRVGSPDWEKLEQDFVDSFEATSSLSDAPRRTQNRLHPPASDAPAVARGWQHFHNEPDTDFALPQNGEWARQIVEHWIHRHGPKAAQVSLVIAGQDLFAGADVGDCLDPSRPGVVVGRYRRATAADAARAVQCAAADPDGWRSLSARARFDLLGRVAHEIRKGRAELLGAALANGGKTISESDPEVSEAVDFLEFYRDTARWWQEQASLGCRPKGAVVVVSPWNFPIAIPCGGVAAALAAGNTVILKPASDTVLVAWELCQCFWRAGISKNVLQFVPCSGGTVGRSLINDPQISAVVLTGGTETALTMLGDNPRLNLLAETGGKNCTIVTALADRDQAIKHVLHSAFSHSGQKCSATSLLLLQDEVYDDPSFRRALAEAAESLKVGSAWELDTRLGPLIRPPSGALLAALTSLEPGEEWALEPRRGENNPNLWSPGIKYGVRPGSPTHLAELFGPHLSVMRFTRLSEAVALVNQTGYGLASGLESLDEREALYWQQHVHAGNLYINRVTTGAIVLRQPFGGFGKSCFGPGLKVGSPNYVVQLMDFNDSADPASVAAPPQAAGSPAPSALAPDRNLNLTLSLFFASLRRRAHPDAERVIAAAQSYQAAWLSEFSRDHDHFQLLGQDNFRRYLPIRGLRIRVHGTDTAFEIFARAGAAFIAGCQATLSTPPGVHPELVSLLEEVTEPWAGALEFLEETDEQLLQAMRDKQIERIRYAHADRVALPILRAAADASVSVIQIPVSAAGRLELLWYMREQSLSVDYHRYGNLGLRAASETATEGTGVPDL